EALWRANRAPGGIGINCGVHIGRFVSAVNAGVPRKAFWARNRCRPAVVMDGQMHRLRGVADIVAQDSGNIDRVGACRLTVTRSLRVAPESKRINQTPVVFDD